MTAPEARQRDVSECCHDWEVSDPWGVIVGVSKCRRCGRVSHSDDFPAALTPQEKPDAE